MKNNDYTQNGVHCRGGPMCPPECRNVTIHVDVNRNGRGGPPRPPGKPHRDNHVDVFGRAHRPSPTGICFTVEKN